MRINVDRLCELAGVSGVRRNRSSSLMKESVAYEEGAREIEEEQDMADFDKKMGFDEGALDEALDEDDEDDKDEGMGHAYEGEETEKDKLDEMIEIDEVDLVLELRRARVLMKDKKRKEARRKSKLQEMQLRGIIDQEVKNVIKELQLTAGWIYGDKKPARSKKGYTHQGTFLKGIGFK